MFRKSRAFSSFAVNDVEAARKFYAQTLGLEVSDVPGMKGLLQLNLAGGAKVMVYPKPDHTPATYTVLNFPVADVGAAVDKLTAAGVAFEHYDGFNQDERGIMRDQGPPIAWFKDPAGNVLAVLEG